MEFLNNIKVIYGERGRAWLENLHSLVSNLALKWNLRDLVPCEDLSYNYVISGWRNDSPVILKVGIDHAAIEQECSAIHAFNGHGLIKL